MLPDLRDHQPLRDHRLFLATTLSLTLLASIALPATAASGTLPGHFGGNGHAAWATAEAGALSVTLGRAAFAPCPCLGTRGKVRSNRVTDIEVDGLVTIDVTESKVYATKSRSRTARTWSRSKVSGLDLLDGLITADLVQAVADVDADPARIRATAARSRFADLRIAGVPVGPSVAPGTRIDLPGLGFVKVREVRRFGSGVGRRGIMVTMIRVRVTVEDNAFELPVGVEIYVGRARSFYDRSPVPVQLRGAAFATRGKSKAAIVKNQIGKAAAMYVGCEGTGGKTKSNVVEDYRAGDLMRLESGRSTVMGEVQGDVGTVKTTSRVENAWLLDLDLPVFDKLVSVDLLKAVARATYDRRARSGSVSSEGSKIANIQVAGVLDIPIVVPPNTKIDIPGVGRLILYKRTTSVSRSAVHIKVIMLRLVIEDAIAALGIPAGTWVELGNAAAGVGRR